MNDPTPRRKLDHVQLCCSEDVEFKHTTTLLEDVALPHCALPEISADDVALGTKFLGRDMQAPLLIGATTGGAEGVEEINRDLARAAQQLGIGMQLGSQRAMVEHPELTPTYAVRDVAPDILLLGNIGLPQARDLSDAQLRALIDDIDADGLCLHLNAAQEYFQREGDRDFSGGLDAIRRLADVLGEKLIVKETGCGISGAVAQDLVEAGVQTLDVAGAGGTSWVRIEQLRSGEETPFSEWGMPTALCLIESQDIECTLIASGGLRSGLDVAKCLALGASLGAAALPFLRAQQRGGAEAAAACGRTLIRELRAACFLTGVASVEDLADVDVILTGKLAESL